MKPDVANGEVHVLACNYARPHGNPNLKLLKKQLWRLLGKDVSVRICRWNVEDSTPNGLAQQLDGCSIFYMMGGEPTRFQQLFTEHRESMGILSSYVKNKDILYIGGCGGAIAAGTYYPPHEGLMLDFVRGVITVDDNEHWARLHQVPQWMNGYGRLRLTKRVAVIVYDGCVKAFVCARPKKT